MNRHLRIARAINRLYLFFVYFLPPPHRKEEAAENTMHRRMNDAMRRTQNSLPTSHTFLSDSFMHRRVTNCCGQPEGLRISLERNSVFSFFFDSFVGEVDCGLLESD
ncbi:hypothetical protein TNCT_324101 [Trichonephila clavata]|uniref:Uncharacterized protein n=1 Tax=Trichonephila clavata TaxID=2740835 RepID=A0A8X6JMJ4_TRICU|nr:hypothetical protein TNCT_324101 [Trichonephila clavata]